MLATRVMRGQPARPYTISLLDLDYVAVKAPIFSFTRLRGADPTLGVEMASTGEVACFGRDVREAYLQALLAANFNLPERRSDHFILLSIAEDRQRMDFLESARELQSLGFQLAATPGTAEFYRRQGLSDIVVLEKPSERASNNNDGDETEELDEKSALRWIRLRRVDLVINLPEGTARRDEVTAGYRMRRAAVDYGISLLTNLRCAVLFVEALAHHLRRAHALPVLSVEELVGHVDPRSVAVSLTTA